MRLTLLGSLAFALLLAGCGEAPPAPDFVLGRAVKEVWTTFYPTTYLARRIAGDLAKVVCPLPEDEDPAFWQPDAATLRGYQQADLIVLNGASFERWVGTASLPTSRVVDASKPFEASFLQLEGITTHVHGPGGAAHTHEGIDGHTWFDPVNAKAQALAIHRALARLLPDRTAELDRNRDALGKDLDALDAAFRALGSLPEGQHLYFSHPAWNYAAQRYGWKRVNLAIAPEEPLKEEDDANIRASLAEKPGRFVLWEDTPLPATAERLEKDLGLRSLVVPPCETESAEDRAAGRDFLTRMQANVETLRPAFSP